MREWETPERASAGRHDAARYGFFFFQAEDGIRLGTVTGVQTCALPISRRAKPVSRLISVANAMPHERETTAASDSSGRPARRLGAGPRGSRGGGAVPVRGGGPGVG